MTNPLATQHTGEIRTGDIVRIGKGKANWTVTALPSAAAAGISLVSDKGAYRALDTAETLTVIARDGEEMLTAWLNAEYAHLTAEAARTRTELAGVVDALRSLADMPELTAVDTERELTASEMSAIESVTADTAENQEDRRAMHAEWELDLLDDARKAGALNSDSDGASVDDAEIYEDAACPACGDPIDYCPGHGESGDPRGFEILTQHESGEHSACNPNGCEIAATIEQHTDQDGHVDYPHEPGYLIDCPACENGPCVCSAPCEEISCVSSGHHAPGARWQHLSACVSSECQHPDNWNADNPPMPDGVTPGTPWPVSSASEAHSDQEPATAPDPAPATGWRAVPAPVPNRAQRRAAQRADRRAARRADKGRDAALSSLRAMGMLDSNWFRQ